MRSQDTAELAQTLFEEIGDAAFITDPASMRLVDVNPMAQRMTGLSRHELLRLPLDKLFRSDGDIGLKQLQRALHTTQTFHSQEGYYLRRGADGNWIPVNLTLTRLHTEGGQQGLVLARDVTDRVQAEERLRIANVTLERRVRERTAELAQVNESLRQEIAKHESVAAALRQEEERFRGAFEHTAVAMVLTDIDNRFIRVNAAFAQLFGYLPSEMLGMTVADVTHPDDLAESYSRREVLLAGFSYFFQMEKRYVHRTGSRFWGLTNVSLVRDAAGRPQLYVGQVQDITERKRAEEELLQARRRLEHVVASSPAILFTLAIEGNQLRGINWISDNLRELLGHEPEDAYRENWWREHVHPEDRKSVLSRTQSQLFAQGSTSHEHRFRHGNGSYRWMRGEIRLIRGSAGNPLEAVGSWSDVTEQKLLEDQFRQSQKMEAVGRLAGGVAHDFNNLLTVINGYGELMLRGMKPGDPNADLVRQVIAAGERASGLTRQLLTFSRKAAVEPRVLDLRSVVADVDRMLRRILGEDVQLTVVADPQAGTVMADAGQVEQILLNLVVNARDAMPRGGKLTIEVRNVELDETYTRTRLDSKPGFHVLLAVSDTGCGMDQATIARVFEPFFTTKGERGTGLGLATVHGIVKQSGGHVAVYSEVGRGTTFKVYFPRSEKLVRSPAPSFKQLAMPPGNETVLLVEDEEGVRALARHILQGCGYTILEAGDGKEAIRLAHEHEGRIDLLVTDVILPEMGGRDIAERLANDYPGLKILFLSGYTDDAVVRHGILHAQVAFLQKPFTPIALGQKVRDVLDNK